MGESRSVNAAVLGNSDGRKHEAIRDRTMDAIGCTSDAFFPA